MCLIYSVSKDKSLIDKTYKKCENFDIMLKEYTNCAQIYNTKRFFELFFFLSKKYFFAFSDSSKNLNLKRADKPIIFNISN